MDNPNDSDHNESNAQMHEVFLRRYTLTYSAYFPPLFRSWICLCENVVPTSWLSHYTLIVGNYYFDLERKGSRPFASTAKFHGRKSSNEVEHLSDKDKWRPVDEWLGTTAISPDTIETKRSFYGVFVGLYFLLHLDAWRAVKVVTATIISYPIMIGVPAYHILAFLKSKNEVNQLLEDDEQKRIDAAYNFITTHMTCHCCNRNHWLCIFRQIVHHPTKGLEPLADFVDQEVYEEPFGREDLGRAINRFEKERTGNTFMSWMYLVQLIMSDMRREGNPALDYMREW
ncbi:hypothetical protein GT037_010667 [Alternaria burnsii]|uniref:Uncharacterized protein n=1 Tax=Alternaria burnsii TaxID=1187904 RepID=A0A8H7AYF0_9PLEO|nr:uncharacterized protein GT037_010667 [Alternaria burnsii]KAF7671342.1 hypothetical protein GT037_010667 [Alternaria burnsii]